MQKITKKATTWRTMRLGELNLDISDGNYSSKYPAKTDFVKRGVPFIRANNFRDGKITWDDMRFISAKKHQELKKGHLKQDDVLITTRGEIGKIAYIDHEFVDANINAQIVRINTLDKIDPRFFFYLLLHKSRSGYFQNIQTGTALQQLPVGILKNIEIALPDLLDQKCIAGVLSAFDDKIENNNRTIKTLDEMAQTIFKEWFVDFNFPGYENTEFVNSELGRIPKGWEVKNVMKIIVRIPVGKKCENKTALPTGKVPILDQGQSGCIGYHNDEAGVVVSIENPVVVFTNHTCNYRLITYPFSAIQNVLPYIGRNGYPTLFIYYLTREKITMQEYKGHWPEFEQQDFLLPPTKLAEMFAEFMNPMTQKMVGLENENQKIATMRDLLLPKLMSGEVRV